MGMISAVSPLTVTFMFFDRLAVARILQGDGKTELLSGEYGDGFTEYPRATTLGLGFASLRPRRLRRPGRPRARRRPQGPALPARSGQCHP